LILVMEMKIIKNTGAMKISIFQVILTTKQSRAFWFIV
jgi:hypothetical protein